MENIRINNTSLLKNSLVWYDNFNFDKLSINLIQYLKDPSKYNRWFKKSQEESYFPCYAESKNDPKIIEFNEYKRKSKFFSTIKSDVNKKIIFNLNDGLLSINIGLFKTKRKCILVKKTIISNVLERNLVSFFRPYRIIISLDNRFIKKIISKENSDIGAFGIFKEDNYWGLRINFYDKSFIGIKKNRTSTLSSIVGVSNKINYILKNIIFNVLGFFLNEGFETKWNLNDKKILWTYMITKYPISNLSEKRMSAEDVKSVFKKLKINNRSKRDESIRCMFDESKHLFYQLTLNNKMCYLKEYLIDNSLEEVDDLDNFFLYIDT